MEHYVLSGKVTLFRLIKELKIEEALKCQGRLNWLLDLSNAKLDISVDEIKALGKHLRQYRRQSPCRDEICRISVIVEDDLTFGLWRMLMVHAEDQNTEFYLSKSASTSTQWLTDRLAS